MKHYFNIVTPVGCGLFLVFFYHIPYSPTQEYVPKPKPGAQRGSQDVVLHISSFFFHQIPTT
ncbi:MAG: hypothetical protein WBA93_14650 [Microcoleaceae cyanobacterium]